VLGCAWLISPAHLEYPGRPLRGHIVAEIEMPYCQLFVTRVSVNRLERPILSPGESIREIRMLQLDWAKHTEDKARLTVSIAATAHEVEEAQRLRWRIFVEEQGAMPEPGVPGIEADRFDRECRHLIVRDNASGRAVGTYRVLTADRARRLGGFYTEQEFDLGGLASRRAEVVEIGRSCVDPDYRNGAVIALLWAGLAAVITGTDARFVIGCASISMRDGGREAASVYNQLSQTHMTLPQFRMQPRHPLDLDRIEISTDIKPPPLVKGYLRAGAQVAGPPAVDHAFGTADLPVLLTLERLNPRYARHFSVV
jgi:putative hemolysin